MPYDTLETIEAELGGVWVRLSTLDSPPQPLALALALALTFARARARAQALALCTSPSPSPNLKPSRDQVSDFDIEWAPQSYAANQHLPAAKGKDYALVQTDTHRMKPVTFSGPLPHLDTPWAA